MIAFEDAEGRRREFLSSRDAGFLKPGTRVSVRFDPAEPRRAEHLGGGLVRLGHLLWPAALGAFLVLAATGGRLPAL